MPTLERLSNFLVGPDALVVDLGGLRKQTPKRGFPQQPQQRLPTARHNNDEWIPTSILDSIAPS